MTLAEEAVQILNRLLGNTHVDAGPLARRPFRVGYCRSVDAVRIATFLGEKNPSKSP